MCPLDVRNETEVQSILSSRLYTLKRYNTKTGANSSIKFSVSQDEMPQVHITRRNKLLVTNEYFLQKLLCYIRNIKFLGTPSTLLKTNKKLLNKREIKKKQRAIQIVSSACNFRRKKKWIYESTGN